MLAAAATPSSPRAVPPPSPRPVTLFVRPLQEAVQRLGRGSVALLLLPITFILRVVTVLLRVIALTLRVATALLVVGLLIIGLSFVPEVNARVPVTNEVAATARKWLQRAEDWSGRLLAGSKAEDQAQRPASSPTATSQKPGATRPAATQPLTVRSTPGGATVLLNTRRVGKTPVTLRVAPGIYKVTVNRPGYVSVTRTVTVKPGKAASLSVTLVAR